MRFHGTRRKTSPIPFKMSAARLCILAVLVTAAMCPVAGEKMQNPGSYVPPAVNQMPDPNEQARMQGRQSKEQNFAAVNAERRRQIADDSAKLLKMATDLKAEVDKTDKNMLSLSVIRKAEAIEKLARNVKEKMKLAAGAS